MDPLSITTSVITLLGAARNVYEFLQSIRHADRGLQSLVREVSTLNGFLRSIEKALEDCRGNPYALAHIDPALWKESKIALSDCQETLDQLALVFTEPKRPSRSNTLFRRARVAAELRSRAGEIASFREKISMSNLSLQTLLQVINVSLSLRGNESHDTILRDLRELKDALKKSSQAATVSYSTLFLNEQDTRLVHHLKGLIRAAQEFHTSASTTASTVAGGGETQPPPTDFGDDDSKLGVPYRLPSMKRQQIETYLSQHRQVARAESPASNREGDGTISPDLRKDSETSFEARQVDSDHTFSTIFTSGFSKIAQRALQQLDLLKAEGLLREALKWHSSSGSDDIQHERHLQAQLALCNLLQGNRQGSQALILHLVESSTEQDSVARQLLYALALLQLHELDFEGARDNSKRLWEALQKKPQCKVLESNDAMRLLAMSYQESGDRLLADAIEAELPDIKLSGPLPKMIDFLVDCDELLARMFGLQDSPEASGPRTVVGKIHDLPIAKKPSSLQMREQLLGDVKSPSPESTPSDADNSPSEEADPDFAKNQPKVKKRSWSNLRAFLKPRFSRDTGSIDLYNLHGGAQDSRSKLRKRVKTSHIAQLSPGLDSYSNEPSISDLRTPTQPNQAASIRGDSDTQNDGDSQTPASAARQPEENLTDKENEHQDVCEKDHQLKRQFSFLEGVPDCVSEKIPTIPPDTYSEMPNTEIFELMDTSSSPEALKQARETRNDNGRPNGKRQPRRLLEISRLDRFGESNNLPPPLSYSPIQIPDDFPSDLSNQAPSCEDKMDIIIADSLETEKDIYQLLGCIEAQTQAPAGQTSVQSERRSSSTGSIPTTGYSSSESDTDISSDFDQVTPSTRQTSFDSSFISAGRLDDDRAATEIPPLRSVMRAKSQQATGSATSSEPTRRVSFEATSNNRQAIGLERPLNLPCTRESGREAAGDMAEPQDYKPHTQSHTEFGPAVARFYRRRSPRKTVFRRRLPTSTATGFRKLFRAQSSGDSFDFGFNHALYSGPNAVAGPFTDLDKTETPLRDKTITTSQLTILPYS